jgi:hypothetical protein
MARDRNCRRKHIDGNQQLPQNLKAVLQVVGEDAVLLHLSMRLLNKPQWRVFRNYTESGYDLLLLGPNKQLKIEVKTRQSLIPKRRQKNSVHFTLSEAERNASDFLIAYWFEHNAFFIVPTNKLNQVRSGKKKLYIFVAYFSSVKNDFTKGSKPFLNKWETIIQRIK